MEQTITEPTDDDISRLARQVLTVEALVGALAHDDTDLDRLQEALTRLKPDQTYELQCLGIVFGTLLVEVIDGIDWAMVEDDYGRDPALRYLATSMLLFPMTMISKRVEDGEQVDVRELFDGIVAKFEEIRGEHGPS